MPVDLNPTDTFARRHLGPTEAEVQTMLSALGFESLDAFIDSVVPASIRSSAGLQLPPAKAEHELLTTLRQMMQKNRVSRSFIGMGYNDTITPGVIQRNILENPGWYTQYTPYQAEIAQGRLEALLNFQTVVTDLTGMEIANASLLDEATAAAEAMAMFHALKRKPENGVFFVAEDCHPQTIHVIQTRAEPLGIRVAVGPATPDALGTDVFGALLQYPATDGAIRDYGAFCAAAHENDALVAVATDLMSLTLLKPPGEFGADAAVGNSQRFGVPLGYGGPHAAFFATRESFKRLIPGRIIGVSRDQNGDRALRMALQTREQHIRRERATSNICTAQVLLAVMAGMYAVYHGPEGLRKIGTRIHGATSVLAAGVRAAGFKLRHDTWFDTIRIETGERTDALFAAADKQDINLRRFDDNSLGVALDECTDAADLQQLIGLFAGDGAADVADLADKVESGFSGPLARQSNFLQEPVFLEHHSETAMLRYIRSLEEKDLSLNMSMIPLGSCTMKLNATTEMVPLSWPEVARMHPMVPPEQARGYERLFTELEAWLAEITGFAGVSLQPNAGAQGEYAGLLAIRAYHRSRGDSGRNVCLIPQSAHGTNPASAVMAGQRVVVVKCDDGGNIDVEDVRAKAEAHRDTLAAFMVTYPSTHGVFEPEIKEICRIIHEAGGQVYMDGANLNAQLGLCRPAELGADVCHLNLHKTFSIPHGGGGPGMGPIGVAAHLLPFLPAHPLAAPSDSHQPGPVSAAHWGSASILTISWAYIAMMGGEGLTRASKIAILNANYMAHRLSDAFPVLYRGPGGHVGHEFILDFRSHRSSAGVEIDDIAKRLIDFGFHAPTMSFPVPGTMMIEPTESENLAELDRFCEALIAIRREIETISRGDADKSDNPLKHAPHTVAMVTASEWPHSYSREQAAFPAPWTRGRKFWPAVARVDNAYGDRHLICTCGPVEDFETS